MPECDEKMRNKIWVCWWQGLDNAPEIVKTCVESIKRNSGKYEVLIITDENYKQYVKFPDWLEEKRKHGIISKTIYSDLLRLNLYQHMEEYGLIRHSFVREKVLNIICNYLYGPLNAQIIYTVPLQADILQIIH